MAEPATWVFGYGSLVSPASLARTIGRTAVLGVDAEVADLRGYGRRWNYGSVSFVGDWMSSVGRPVVAGTIVALGVVESAGESVSGVINLVTDEELAGLDQRERNYDRVDVTDCVEADGARRIVTYVPRRSSIERYELARDAGTAAVRRSYWDLVDDAFAELGQQAVERYRASTPSPDVPVVEVTNIRAP